ncbi:MAG: flagellar hook basal-body protein [Pseudomonadota bacterium]
MSGLIESAAAILSASESRLEIAAHNVSNISTPGFKRQVGFSQLLANGAANSAQQVTVRRDFAQGKLSPTSNPLDVAISGTGFFQLRSGDTMIYSRQGQFSRAADGTVVTPQGYALQQAGGGDLVLNGAAVSILEDGTVLEDGVPVARLAVFAPADPAALQPVGESAFAMPGGAMDVVPDAVFRQGMVENSNVAVGDEMVTMMTALRQSEGGARLVQVYDDLLGRALSTLGQSGK